MEIGILNKKISQLSGLLHERENTVAEMEHLFGESNKKVQIMGHQSNHSKNNIVLLENRLAQIQSQNRICQEQIAKLTQLCKAQEMELNNKEKTIEKLVEQYNKKQIQWSNTL